MPTGGEGKRAAPISASAFSFSLAKKPKGPSLPTPPKLKSPPPLPPNPNPQRPITSLGIVTPTRPKPAPKTPKPSGPLGPIPSPFALSPKSVRPQKRLSALEDPSSPFKKMEERKDLQAITAMPRLGVAEVRAVTEVEEGIGVSPRKHKGALHHKGSGPPPSVRLAHLVSGNSTSLVLFYTSLQHTLAGRPRVVAQHVASAPIRLRVSSLISGPTHAAVMVECEVIAWPGGPETVLVVLQALPAGCPRLGLDPRLVGTDRNFEIGVLAPWSEGTVPRGEGDDGDMTVLFASRYLVAERE
ncbi:hypothetical protein CcaverHIS002_0106660 [Cutaneotrichosporon cavernicola]|uniref:Uncharacterized protein n=1 Tax=Cutaneotrichosporon cavernicola TaxID=279322 RepID=A0AA48IDS6_9TREE|nr:uncharacterized protein CcaverHIS019_0106610 [Cutaneotrichosporon cavernicola]BEI80137.1 hypothetical protein CcaverHIS002_0106660 [Cutaneotrichosporon cavernicola]BEI87943.1 hypothetical protein CcaverHIS019_0106610 [Cutaneotrichosporon cavernicola]BEI95716.1 hypothetical protein CcaverHIS631_0106650 [Cutaneotrichosporon cavernicola]BEJ03491.1 hypothetical protein CcaverHIS641_0106660 [Cutaneotrichosporon cavernicola]